MMSEEFVINRIRGNPDFSFSRDEKKLILEAFDLEEATALIFKCIRECGISVCDDVMSDNAFVLKVPALNVSFSPEPLVWQNGGVEFTSVILGTSTLALSLSTTLSGFERYSSKANLKSPSAKEQWDNDEILKRAICDNLSRLLEKEALSRNRLRVHLLSGNGCAYLSTFPVAFVCWLLRRESERLGRPVSYFDPCAGWGDRLAGSLLVGKEVCSQYHAVDPWWKSRSVCHKVQQKLQSPATCDVQIFNHSCVDPAFEWPATDFCFTSPPYGDLECYGCDEEQADERQAWRLRGHDFVDRFLKIMFQKCRSPVFVLNIAGTKKCPDLVALTVAAAETNSRYHLNRELTVGMSLSNRPTKQGVLRAEPLLYFVREE